MSLACRLTRLAERDLLEIGRYTQREWGREQRTAYLRRLHQRMRALAENPRLGLARDDVREGYRSWLEGRHLLFYRPLPEGGILVVRVLHASMDVSRHFPED